MRDEEKEYHVQISAKHRWFDLKLDEVSAYRDLILLFTKKSFTVRYKQTILGPLWLLINPTGALTILVLRTVKPLKQMGQVFFADTAAINLNDITYLNGYSDEYQDTWPYEDFYEGEYPYTNSFPKLLFMNLWLLKYGLGVLQGETNDCCLGINSEVVIPYTELEIIHFND